MLPSRVFGDGDSCWHFLQRGNGAEGRGWRGGDRETAKSLAKNHIPSQAADQEKRPSILEKQWASEGERHKL